MSCPGMRPIGLLMSSSRHVNAELFIRSDYRHKTHHCRIILSSILSCHLHGYGSGTALFCSTKHCTLRWCRCQPANHLPNTAVNLTPRLKAKWAIIELSGVSAQFTLLPHSCARAGLFINVSENNISHRTRIHYFTQQNAKFVDCTEFYKLFSSHVASVLLCCKCEISHQI